VLLIQRALVVGFSLADLKRVLSVRDKGGAPCRSVRELVGKRFDELDRRIEELIRLRDELRLLLSEWDATLAQTPQGQRAHLLETLGSKAGIERTRRSARRPLVPSSSQLSYGGGKGLDDGKQKRKS
jgi:DNA-binding transcriptional MerR regulator